MNAHSMYIDCGQCGGRANFYFRSHDYNRKISNKFFNHYRCKQCGLIFISPVPDDLDVYYPDNYYYIPGSLDKVAKASEKERYKIDIVKRFVANGKLLEIGPAHGSFAFLAKEAGFDVEAIEMSEHCCRYLRDVIGVRAINSNNLISALQSVGPYDVIAMWHVIEHLPDPWSVIDAMYARLKLGGILVIASPNPDAFQFNLMGRYWPHLDSPRHLMLIPMRVLEDRAANLGFDLVLATTTDPGSLNFNIFGWEFLLANISFNRYYRYFAIHIGRFFARLFSSIEKREGQGSTYTLVFRKVLK